jgi:hypothetical protein
MDFQRGMSTETEPNSQNDANTAPYTHNEELSLIQMNQAHEIVIQSDSSPQKPCSLKDNPEIKSLETHFKLPPRVKLSSIKSN